MKIRRTSLIAACALAAALCAPASQASTLHVFNDRAAFENALDSFTVDNLDGVTMSFHGGTVARPDYTYTTASMHGCVAHQDCGSNAMLGWDDAYLWNYATPDTFTFSRAVHGFGFDYSEAYTHVAGFAIVDGRQSLATSGFYGLLYSDARTTFTVDQSVAYMMMDNITVGTAANQKVPEPSGLALLGIGALGLALARSRKRFS